MRPVTLTQKLPPSSSISSSLSSTSNLNFFRRRTCRQRRLNLRLRRRAATYPSLHRRKAALPAQPPEAAFFPCRCSRTDPSSDTRRSIDINVTPRPCALQPAFMAKSRKRPNDLSAAVSSDDERRNLYFRSTSASMASAAESDAGEELLNDMGIAKVSKHASTEESSFFSCRESTAVTNVVNSESALSAASAGASTPASTRSFADSRESKASASAAAAALCSLAAFDVESARRGQPEINDESLGVRPRRKIPSIRTFERSRLLPIAPSFSSSSHAFNSILLTVIGVLTFACFLSTETVAACSRVSAPPPPLNPKAPEESPKVFREEIPCQNITLRKYYCLNGGKCLHIKSIFWPGNSTSVGPYFCHCTPEWIGRRCQDRFIDLTLLGSIGVLVPVVIIIAVVSYVCWRQRRHRGKAAQNNAVVVENGAGIYVENDVGRNGSEGGAPRGLPTTPPAVLGPSAMLAAAAESRGNEGGTRSAAPSRSVPRHPSIGAPLADTDEVDMETPFYAETEIRDYNRF